MLTERLARQWIGGPAGAFSLTVNEKVISGYMGTTELAVKDAKQRVFAHQKEAEKKSSRVFCGSSARAMAILSVQQKSGVFMFAMPGIGEADIAEICDVNVPLEYNSPEQYRAFFKNNPDNVGAVAIRMGMTTIGRLSGPPPKKRRQQIRKFLEQVYARHPFRIHFAERMGLEARFLKPLDDVAAGWLAAEIAKVDIEAFDVADPLTMKEYILKHQMLVLWWD